MELRELVVEIARPLTAIGPRGEINLDSLGVIDVVVALEAQLGVRVPLELLIPDNFNSIDSILTLLSNLRQGAADRVT